MYHLAMTKTHTKTKHFQVPPIEDQLMLGVSHVIEYIRTGKNNFIFVFKDVKFIFVLFSETYKYLYSRHIQANVPPPEKTKERSNKLSRKGSKASINGAK